MLRLQTWRCDELQRYWRFEESLQDDFHWRTNDRDFRVNIYTRNCLLVWIEFYEGEFVKRFDRRRNVAGDFDEWSKVFNRLINIIVACGLSGSSSNYCWPLGLLRPTRPPRLDGIADNNIHFCSRRPSTPLCLCCRRVWAVISNWTFMRSLSMRWIRMGVITVDKFRCDCRLSVDILLSTSSTTLCGVAEGYTFSPPLS